MKRKYIIISLVVFIFTLSAFIYLTYNHHEFKKDNIDNSIALMLENEDGTYTETDSKSFDYIGYTLNNNLSKCENGSQITYDENNKQIVVKSNVSDKCYIYLDKIDTIYDLSSNHLDATLNGATVKKDDEGTIGLYFDGVDDFATLPNIPETINFADGFTYEYTVKWETITKWSRIFDFGNGAGPDVIFSGNDSTTNGLSNKIYYTQDNTVQNILLNTANVIEENKKMKIKVTYTKTSTGYHIDLYKNDSKIDQKDFTEQNIIKNLLRKYNYLGKSNWGAQDDLFNGYIYELKFTDNSNNTLLHYKIS